MGQDSKIEWTDHTFNPWRGCCKVSDGCKFCYAETLSGRNPSTLGIWGPNGTRVLATEATWKEPLKWDRIAAEAGRRARVFCASLADVFEDYSGNLPDLHGGVHGGVRCLVDAKAQRLCTRTGGEIAVQWPDEAGWRPYCMGDARGRLFELIKATPNLDWLLLTKRPENISRMLPYDWEDGYKNVWLGTSVEDHRVVSRVRDLTAVPATIHFLSIEPLIGPISDLPLDGIEWVICGGESGSSARPMHPAWAELLRERCEEDGVPFFFKQWGHWAPGMEASFRKCPSVMISSDGAMCESEDGGELLDFCRDHDDCLPMYKVGKGCSGRLLGGREWNGQPVPSLFALPEEVRQ